MHNCEDFRERITEHIIDREDVSSKPELQYELVLCAGCSEFYAQSREMMEALSGIDLTVSERQWNGIQHRLNAQILNVPGTTEQPPFPPVHAPRRLASFLGAAAALLLIAAGLSRLPVPAEDLRKTQNSFRSVYVERSVPLDPVTVNFLKESELLLRSVMKMEPSDVDDIADAKKVASQQLAELDQRKAAASEVQPVVDVMDTYETVLRDLRNVDERSADEDISDIQKRIRKNGLIANMKSFQPRVTEISFGLK